jgi:3-oxoacyl-[acyl-carrier-protein] synthase II
MIVGGSEAAITPGTIGGFGAAQALSKNNISALRNHLMLIVQGL